MLNIRTTTIISLVILLVPLFVTLPQASLGQNLVTLPRHETTASPDVLVPGLNRQILIEAPEADVSLSDIDNLIQILQNYSVPTLNGDFKLDVSKPLYVRLFDTPSSFKKAEQVYFPAAANSQHITLEGFTAGTTVFIPMYQYKSIENGIIRYANADLANIVTHELTHALINAYHIAVPTWINEGFATYEGMRAQTAYSPNYASRLSNSGYYTLDFIAAKGQLTPLNHNESAILHSSQNLEFEDYAAVAELITDYGLGTFTEFLLACQHHDATEAFQQTYHSSLRRYETFFYEYHQSQ